MSTGLVGPFLPHITNFTELIRVFEEGAAEDCRHPAAIASILANFAHGGRPGNNRCQPCNDRRDHACEICKRRSEPTSSLTARKSPEANCLTRWVYRRKKNSCYPASVQGSTTPPGRLVSFVLGSYYTTRRPNIRDSLREWSVDYQQMLRGGRPDAVRCCEPSRRLLTPGRGRRGAAATCACAFDRPNKRRDNGARALRAGARDWAHHARSL